MGFNKQYNSYFLSRAIQVIVSGGSKLEKMLLEIPSNLETPRLIIRKYTIRWGKQKDKESHFNA
jgi:hypothetical protein